MHTPTPWKMTEEKGHNGKTYFRIRESNYQADDCIGQIGAWTASRDGYEARNNAALIVKAVNSYEAMKEALESIIAYRDHVGPIHFQLEKMDHFLIQARKALALAEGKE